MKTNRILSVALLAVGLVSCTNKVEFYDVPFVAFDKVAVSVEEVDGTVNIPVTAYSFTEPFSLTFETVDGKAIEGDAYEIVDNDARVLRFTPENPTQNIVVDIVNKKGIFTGALDFTINLLTATGDVTLAANTTCKVNIVDKDHPLAKMLGTYTSSQSDAFGQATTTTVTIEPDEDDVTMVWINPIVHFLAGNGIPGDLPVYGIVSEDLKEIEIPYFQKTGYDVSNVGLGTKGDDLTLYSWGISGQSAVIVDSGITSFKFIWDDAAGGYVNDSKFCLGGAITGTLGNYYYLYVPEKGTLLKKN